MYRLNIFRSSYRVSNLVFLGTFFASAFFFGLWFKNKQLSIVSETLPEVYHISGYALSILQTLLLFIVAWLGLSLALYALEDTKSPPSNIIRDSSLPFTAFLLSIFNTPLKYQALGFLILLVILLRQKILDNPSTAKSMREPFLIFLLYLFLFLLLFKTFSPLHHTSFFDTWGRNDFFINLDRQWENAKAYDFLGNFSQQAKLGGYTQGVYLFSELSSLMVLLFDIPVVDDLAKLNTIKFLFFSLYLFASFGAYLFFRFGLKLSLLPSAIGGWFYIFGNAVFLAFLGNEYSIHHSQFTFFPWVMLFISIAHTQQKISLACLAGLIASLAEYAMSSHPEMDILFFIFCNAYNIYLTLIRAWKDQVKSFKKTVKWILLFPVFHVVGLAYRLIPIADAFAFKEFAFYDDPPGGLGIGWSGFLRHYVTLFFRFEGVEALYNPANGAMVTYYTGQFSTLMIFSFLCCTLVHIYQKINFKKSQLDQSAQLKFSLFFFFMYLILASNLPMGAKSWLSDLLKLSGFLRFHNVDRANMFFHFFSLAAAIFGLSYVLNLKKWSYFNYIFLGYLSILTIAYFAMLKLALDPRHPGPLHPDNLLMEITVLFIIYTVVSFYLIAMGRKKKKNSQKPNTSKAPLKKGRFLNGYIADRHVPISLLLLTACAFYSYSSICKNCEKFVATPNNSFFKTHDVYFSFRAQLSHFKNNTHDKASFDFLSRRVNKYIDDIEQDLGKTRLINGVPIDTYYYSRIKNLMKSYSVGIGLFEVLAAEIDSYYFNRGSSMTLVGADIRWLGPAAYNINNAFQFYLPEEPKLFTLYTQGSVVPLVYPLGKHSALDAGYFYSTGPCYPSADINFHLRALKPNSLNNFLRHGYNYGNQPLELQNLSGHKNKFMKKVIDIIGLDYFVFQKLYLQDLEQSEDVEQNILSMGFRPYDISEAFKFEPRHRNFWGLRAFQNPASYGKAYIAKWVKTIKPEKYLVRKSIVDLPKFWPRSPVLIENFKNLISLIPHDIWRAALIETEDLNELNTLPQKIDTINKVDIVKIIGSKASFNVDCEEPSCWFIYNTAALRGWRAYSGLKSLPIKKANLGFIGLKLNHGKHFLWMEYQSLAPIIGLVLTTFGWIFVFLMEIILFSRSNTKTIQLNQNNQALPD